MLDRLADALFGGREPAAVLHDRLAQELGSSTTARELRLDLPFAERGDVSLKKIGLELVVRVDGQKRTIVLPPALAGLHARAARLFEDGALRGRSSRPPEPCPPTDEPCRRAARRSSAPARRRRREAAERRGRRQRAAPPGGLAGAPQRARDAERCRPELSALVDLVEALRGLLPPELARPARRPLRQLLHRCCGR